MQDDDDPASERSFNEDASLLVQDRTAYLSRIRVDDVDRMRAEIADWLTRVTGRAHGGGDGLMSELKSGLALLNLARILQSAIDDGDDDAGAALMPEEVVENSPREAQESNSAQLVNKQRANSHKFVSWCRRIGVRDVTLFEAADLVNDRNERQVLTCILNVSKIVARYGFEPPESVKEEIRQEEIRRKKLEMSGWRKTITVDVNSASTNSDATDHPGDDVEGHDTSDEDVIIASCTNEDSMRISSGSVTTEPTPEENDQYRCELVVDQIYPKHAEAACGENSTVAAGEDEDVLQDADTKRSIKLKNAAIVHVETSEENDPEKNRETDAETANRSGNLSTDIDSYVVERHYTTGVEIDRGNADSKTDDNGEPSLELSIEDENQAVHPTLPSLNEDNCNSGNGGNEDLSVADEARDSEEEAKTATVYHTAHEESFNPTSLHYMCEITETSYHTADIVDDDPPYVCPTASQECVHHPPDSDQVYARIVRTPDCGSVSTPSTRDRSEIVVDQSTGGQIMTSTSSFRAGEHQTANDVQLTPFQRELFAAVEDDDDRFSSPLDDQNDATPLAETIPCQDASVIEPVSDGLLREAAEGGSAAVYVEIADGENVHGELTDDKTSNDGSLTKRKDDDVSVIVPDTDPPVAKSSYGSERASLEKSELVSARADVVCTREVLIVVAVIALAVCGVIAMAIVFPQT